MMKEIKLEVGIFMKKTKKQTEVNITKMDINLENGHNYTTSIIMKFENSNQGQKIGEWNIWHKKIKGRQKQVVVVMGIMGRRLKGGPNYIHLHIIQHKAIKLLQLMKGNMIKRELEQTMENYFLVDIILREY
ncbi:unnamed protein product [Paramecium sonneborni]|uniref:Uncharacterized protein n=1 Tax=Paramecium sonneborni TaxID=65129 RepID=A0A8S1RPU4_9CILI|nr:unnamed protein product [Paramecium sonneborni]